jgi:hypothetical protein
VPYSVGFTYPGATCRALGAHCSCPTLRYKRLGQAPLPRGGKKKRVRQGRLEHNTTQFSHGRRVLHSGSPNHVNYRVHHIHLELTTKWLKTFPTEEPQWAAPEGLRWKCHKTTSTFDAPGRGKQLACGANRRFLVFSSVAMVSMAASSHPSPRERESEQETTSRSRAGRSRRSRGRTDTTTVVLESQPTTGTTASPPAAVGPDVALLAARQLLNNPPPPRASPSAAEQLRHNVD